MSNERKLDISIYDLEISEDAKNKLHLSGIDTLADADHYTIDNYKTMLFRDEKITTSVIDEIIDVFRKNGIPSNLSFLSLSDELIKHLKENDIKSTSDLLAVLQRNRSELYSIIRVEKKYIDEINNVLEFYQISALSYYDYDAHYEMIKNQKEFAEIDVQKRIKQDIKRDGFGNKTFSHFKIRLASPDEIRMWSYGEVKTHETINYRSTKPEKDGLFCERIFGPTKDQQCDCGKKTSVNRGQVCPKCGIEITDSLVRRERMGHIELAAPIVHTWYLKNSPSRIAMLLGIKVKDLEKVVYLHSYIVINPGTAPLERKQIIDQDAYARISEKFSNCQFEVLTGAEAIKRLLQEIDLKKELETLKHKYKVSTKQIRDKIVKRLEVVEMFYNSDNKPEWMVMDVIPVIAPDLRPMVPLDGGQFATTDLNDLYRRIINRNNRLKEMKKMRITPDLLQTNEKRMLQMAVDSLFDNAKAGYAPSRNGEKKRLAKSLSDLLRGKQGRFRQNLLGKRVDYSGRSVIIVGPDLKMYQAGIPREMAIILFKPFVLNSLQKKLNIEKRKDVVAKYDSMDDDVWQSLEEVVIEHPILLNRAPTLHRLGIQAFEPKLIDGKAIRLHPLVCTAFNADFDGDQMPIHVPLSPEAQAEARLLMLASNNILSPKDGKPVVTPSQDMVLGNYYLTIETPYNPKDEKTFGSKNEGQFFSTVEEAEIAYENKLIDLHTRIFIKPTSLTSKFKKEYQDQYLSTTLGKIIFNKILPKDFPFIESPTKEDLENGPGLAFFLPKGGNPKDFYKKFDESKLPKPFAKKFLSMLIAEIFKRYQIAETSKMLDNLKDLGFKYSTIAGFTVSFADIKVYSKKKDIISQADKECAVIDENYEMGLLTQSERKGLLVKVWEKARNDIQTGLMAELPKDNHLTMMSDSGARGNVNNFTQLAGMRGLMNNPKGDVIEVPVKASFREGLSVSEFFISTHGARKGSTDTALKTAESGYLTRRLVDVSQDILIVEDDCHTERGVNVSAIKDENNGGKVVVPLKDRILGRYAACDILNPKNKEVLIYKNEIIDEDSAILIEKLGIESVYIRTNLTCDSEYGVCAKCYGRNLANNKPVEIGEAVGVIAAQSIGEPGTQLTMRTFHTGGVASAADITQGLPRIQELFEVRNPKGKAVISEYNGKVLEVQKDSTGISTVVIVDEKGKEHLYKTEANVDVIVRKNKEVKAGDKLTQGSIYPKELLRVTSVERVQKYILEEVQKVYYAQGVEISDKHVEIILRQMLKRMMIISEGDTNLLSGIEVSINDYKKENRKAFENKLRPAIARPIILGITRAALRSESFLSSASFQETTRILTDAAICGARDELRGLKENVIIGGLIPAGTGILQDTKYEYDRLNDINLDEE